jgi:hypothetical protein
MQSNKLKELRNYSDPEYVMNKAKMMGLNPVHESSRKDKKYMVFSPIENKMIHFGSLPYEDYTKHHDEQRLIKFRKRNWKWQFAPKYSPAYLSYNLLW